MRISDWSSDVCSSDLHDLLDLRTRALRLFADDGDINRHLPPAIDGVAGVDDLGFNDSAAGFLRRKVRAREKHHADRKAVGQRSEEHTSELQSLMRISYAVLCLKQKTKANSN